MHDLRKQGEESWRKIGEQYLQENEDKYTDLIKYEPEFPPYYPEHGNSFILF